MLIIGNNNSNEFVKYLVFYKISLYTEFLLKKETNAALVELKFQ